MWCRANYLFFFYFLVSFLYRLLFWDFCLNFRALVAVKRKKKKQQNGGKFEHRLENSFGDQQFDQRRAVGQRERRRKWSGQQSLAGRFGPGRRGRTRFFAVAHLVSSPVLLIRTEQEHGWPETGASIGMRVSALWLLLLLLLAHPTLPHPPLSHQMPVPSLPALPNIRYRHTRWASTDSAQVGPGVSW